MKAGKMGRKAVDLGLCARFKEVREHYAPTQAVFAELFGIPRSNVSDIERGSREPSKHLLNMILARGDFAAKWLLHGEGERMVEEEKYNKFSRELIKEKNIFRMEIDKKYIEDLNSAYEKAYQILFEALRAAEVNLMMIDPVRFAKVLRIAAREILQDGDKEPVRQAIVRDAEILLGLMKEDPKSGH